jgi:hypothetical protein
MADVVLNFYWYIPGKLATGGKPSRLPQLDWLIEQGFHAFVSLEAIPDNIYQEIIQRGKPYLYWPLREDEKIEY